MEGGEAGRFLGRIEGIGWLLRKNRIENGSRADPRKDSESINVSVFIALLWVDTRF